MEQLEAIPQLAGSVLYYLLIMEDLGAKRIWENGQASVKEGDVWHFLEAAGFRQAFLSSSAQWDMTRTRPWVYIGSLTSPGLRALKDLW